MNPSLSRILAAIADPQAPIDDADIDAAATEYPFFILPAAEALRRRGAEMTAERRKALMARIALNAPDPAAVFVSCGAEGADLMNFYPAERREVSTEDAISKFLDTYGHSDPAQDALLERLIFNPVPPDYAALLEAEGEKLPEPGEAPDGGQTAPAREEENSEESENSEVSENSDSSEPSESPEAAESSEPSESPRQPHTAPGPAHDTSLSESLAKIYIRQKRFDKAFEIIHTLSLNNPKKSAYFADQLRFLAKLMLVRESHKPE
ncbi:MAG: hypothetical protein K2H83_00555 [Duncaniella sp.]|nr:hypothetical protein [Duncaniella sp.]